MKVFRPHTVASQALMLPPFQRRLNPWQWCASQFIWVIFFGKLCNFLEVCCSWPPSVPHFNAPFCGKALVCCRCCPVGRNRKRWRSFALPTMLSSWEVPWELDVSQMCLVEDTHARIEQVERSSRENWCIGRIPYFYDMAKSGLCTSWVLLLGFLRAGFNLDSIEGEKLPTFAKTLKTGAIRDPRWCSLMTTMATLLFWGDDITLGSSKLPVKSLGWNLHQREQMSPWELWGSGKWEQSTRRVLLGFVWIWCQCQWCQWCSCNNVTFGSSVQKSLWWHALESDLWYVSVGTLVFVCFQRSSSKGSFERETFFYWISQGLGVAAAGEPRLLCGGPALHRYRPSDVAPRRIASWNTVSHQFDFYPRCHRGLDLLQPGWRLWMICWRCKVSNSPGVFCTIFCLKMQAVNAKWTSEIRVKVKVFDSLLLLERLLVKTGSLFRAMGLWQMQRVYDMCEASSTMCIRWDLGDRYRSLRMRRSHEIWWFQRTFFCVFARRWARHVQTCRWHSKSWMRNVTSSDVRVFLHHSGEQ